MRRLRGQRSTDWNRSTYTFCLTLFVSVLIPTALISFWLSVAFDERALVNSAMASTVAIVGGAWLLAGVTRYPGAEASAHIVPSFSLSYGILLLALLFSRFEYNRILLAASFLTSVIIYYGAYFSTQRKRFLKIGIIAFGSAETLSDFNGIDWVALSSPNDPTDGLDAVTTDLRVDLPDAWDRRLADFALDGLPVYHCKQLGESLTGRVDIEHLSENSFGTLSPAAAYMAIKHTIDFFLAFTALLLLLPLVVIIAAAVRLETSGPVIFRQTRTGFRGSAFTVFKFRTMRNEARRAGDARREAMTRVGDSRITRVGRFLRRTRLDEIPQLLNVLRGEMSLIGPRPEAQILSRWYEDEIPFYRYRHIVRPGITGWAQVTQGHVAEIDDVRNKLQYDFYYIKHLSPWVDLLIVARTIRTLLSGFGAR